MLFPGNDVDGQYSSKILLFGNYCGFLCVVTLLKTAANISGAQLFPEFLCTNV